MSSQNPNRRHGAFKFFCASSLLLACAACARDHTRNGQNTAPSITDNGADAAALAEYDVLFKRNIFSREQPRKRVEHVAAPEKSDAQLQEDKDKRDKDSANKADADIVLMGLVIRDEQRFAVLEDRRAGKTITAKPGQPVGSGKAGEISMEALEFVGPKATLKINIGNNLLGGVSAAKPLEGNSAPAPVPASATGGTPAVPGSAAGDGTAPAEGAPATVDTSSLSVIEKMRLKRQKENAK